MSDQKELEFLTEEYLKVLGIETPRDWDVLVFLYRHQSSLVSAEHIARLLGYETGAVVQAIGNLESLGLVARSRVSQGVRLYEFILHLDPEHGKFDRLMNLTDSRAGRLYMINKLRGNQTMDRKSDLSALSSLTGGERWPKAN